MLKWLMEGVVGYLQDTFPEIPVSRSYSPQLDMVAVQKDATIAMVRLLVTPPTQTGDDTLLSRRPTVRRNVGVDVGMVVKPRSWENEEIDPYAEMAENIRKSLWSIPPVAISAEGYERAIFVKLEDQFCGIPEAHSQLFVALLTPRFVVDYR